jgi:polysaccharide export outer membrane protein
MISVFLSACVTPTSETGTVSIRSLPKEAQSEYLLAPEDMIEVLVWKNESLSRIALIRPDGKITLPLLGDVEAAGLTPQKLSDKIKGRLQTYYKEPPDVFVAVTAVNSFSIFILGEVIAPGKQVLHSETTVLQALSLARGFNEYADPNNILLLRKEGAIEKRIRLSYRDILSGQHPEMNLLLKAGDTLVIP